MNLSKKSFLLFFSTLLFSVTLTALAQDVVPATKLSEVACFDYYKFQSVQVSVGSEQTEYQAGETINFVGEVINQNGYPVVDGNIFVRLSKINPNYLTDGHNAVDEILPLSNISVGASSSLPVSFSWKSPKNLGAGDYRAEYFFSVGKKFNLGGLPFTNEIIVGFSNFKITSSKDTEFVLDRSTTKVNGEDYNHVGSWPFIAKENKVEIIQPLKNLSNKELKVEVSYDLYSWDSLNDQDKIESKRETVTLAPNSSKNLSYIISKITQPVYYLKIKATTDGVSSIVNVRVTSNIEKTRINYPGLTTFPLKAGDEASLFSCFHSIYGLSNATKLTLSLTDRDGNTVAAGEYTGNIGTAMKAAATKFTADKEYRYLNLKAELFDGNNKLVESYQTKYDCSAIKTGGCESTTDLNTLFILSSLILILLSLVSLFLLSKSTSRTNLHKVLNTLFILLTIVSVITLVWTVLARFNIVGAESVSSDGKTKTETRSSPLFLDWKLDSQRCRNLYNGQVSLNYSATLNGDTSLKVGDSVSISTDVGCTYNGSGGFIDTPNCGQKEYYDAGASNHPAEPDSFTLSNDATGISITSSNNSVISCSGSTCTAKAPGTATVYANFADTNVAVNQSRFWSNDYWHNDLSSVTVNKCLNGVPIGSTRNIVLGGYSPSWGITIADPGTPPTGIVPPPTNISLTCPAPGTTATISWTAPSGYNNFNWRANPVPPGGPSLPVAFSGNNFVGTSKTFSSTPGQTYKAWVHTYSGGVESVPAVSGEVVCTPATFAASCAASPSPATVNQPVSWTANPSGGIGPYTYAWTFSDGSTANNNVVSKTYSAPGTYYATTTVRDNANHSVTISCPGTVSSGGSGCSGNCGHGITVTSGSVDGVCYVGGPYSSAPTNPSLCAAGTAGPVSGSGPWTWTCNGLNGGSNSPLCSATKSGDLTGPNTFNCAVSMVTVPDTLNQVAVNTNTQWTISSDPGYDKHWKIFENGATSTPAETSATLNHIFTTVGLKTVSIEFSSSTAPGTWYCGNSPSATTSVVLPGSIKEN